MNSLTAQPSTQTIVIPELAAFAENQGVAIVQGAISLPLFWQPVPDLHAGILALPEQTDHSTQRAMLRLMEGFFSPELTLGALA